MELFSAKVYHITFGEALTSRIAARLHRFARPGHWGVDFCGGVTLDATGVNQSEVALHLFLFRLGSPNTFDLFAG